MYFMTNHELFPIGNREGIKDSTSYERAQQKFDELVDAARKTGARVEYYAAGESKPPSSALEEINLFDSLETTPLNDPTSSHKHDIKKPKKRPKTHNTRGLNGFYGGNFYRNGVPQNRPKNRRPR